MLRVHQSGSPAFLGLSPLLNRVKDRFRVISNLLSQERIAGFRLPEIKQAVHGIALCLREMHELGVCHGDVKQRNVLRVAERWQLCDMDSVARFGAPIGEKTSTAYCPPELAKMRFTGPTACQQKRLPAAHPSFDVWSLGVVLFELCAGHTLLNQDISNDELIEVADKARLVTWRTISDEELGPVLADVVTESHHQAVADAKNLIRWCLQGEPRRRPSVVEVLSHRFLCPGSARPAPQPMQYHAFMSHAQADASGTVAAMYFAYKKLGLHNWIDMRQSKLTLEGMRQGVQDSDVFLLVLTKHVLASWFCQQEMLAAIGAGKKVQLLLEEEERFAPFDVSAWQAGQGQDRRTACNASGSLQEVPTAICEMIDSHLREAVTYRRRDFEAASMMTELCRRNGLVLPCSEQEPWPSAAAPLRVYAVHNKARPVLP